MQNALRYFARNALSFTAVSLAIVFMVAPFTASVSAWVLIASPALLVAFAGGAVLALQNSYELSLSR